MMSGSLRRARDTANRLADARYINVTWDMPELTSPEMRQKIVDGDLLKVQLTLPQ